MVLHRQFWYILLFAMLNVTCSITPAAKEEQTETESTESLETAETGVMEDATADAVAETQDSPDSEETVSLMTVPNKQRAIKTIIVVGNKFTPTQAILNQIPYKVGELFDPIKTSTLIRNLYNKLKRFRNIIVKGQLVNDDGINLIIEVEEKHLLKDVAFQGNRAVTENEIIKKVDLNIPAVDQEELQVIAEQIKRLYMEKGYLTPLIDVELELDEEGKAIAKFTIKEGKKSLIRRIDFVGNKAFSDKELREIALTKEDWILSFLDKSGTYIPERIDGDKYMIEKAYQNRGYAQAKITDVRIDEEPNRNRMNITFEIEEGDQFTVGDIKAPGNDMITEEQLLSFIPIRRGQVYSREAIEYTIKQLEQAWGSYGYIFTHIEPSIQVNEETKTVDLTFNSDIGSPVFLNRITVKGNQKTRDKVIRRRLALTEGQLLTNNQMEASKQNVQSLGYFNKQDGVNWKLKRVAPELADLELIVKEEKTGSFNFELSYGGSGFDLRNPNSGVSVKGTLSDSNLFGSGINMFLEASWARDQQTFVFHIAEPWLFDKPISVGMDIYHKRPVYDELRNLRPPQAINEKLTGGVFSCGFVTPPAWDVFHDVQVMGSVGVDSVRYGNPPIAQINRERELFTPAQTAELTVFYQNLLNKEFNPGDFLWVAALFEQDRRNHPLHVSRGHRWKVMSRIALPSFNRLCDEQCRIGFGKVTLDSQWFNPLINEFDLVFRLRMFFGFALQFNGRTIPYGELFNIGGPASVRGYTYGQISPKFLGDPIGASKAFFINAELVFPITPDFNMKGVIFYDGGAGWDNPNVRQAIPGITSNTFDYRHAVGVGFRLYSPMPVKIDWGFKIDPRPGESPSEIHFGTSFDW